jgi:hypothetical protein
VNTSNIPNSTISTASTSASAQGNSKSDGGYGPNYFALSFELKF